MQLPVIATDPEDWLGPAEVAPSEPLLSFASAFEECPGSYWTLERTVPSQTIGWSYTGWLQDASMRNKGRGGGAWRGPTRRMLSRLRSHPSNSVLSPWQPLRYWRGPWFKGLGSASSGPLDRELSRLDWAVCFAADWPRPGRAGAELGKRGQKYQGRRVQDGSGLLG